MKLFKKKMEGKTADEWLNLAHQAKYQDPMKAIECCDKAINIKPNDAAVWYEKGFNLGQVGRYEEAIECYDKAINIKPNNDHTWTFKGIALDSLGKYKEAVECCDKAIKINPKGASTWRCKGDALSNLGRYKDALNCYNKALELGANGYLVEMGIKIVEEKLRGPIFVGKTAEELFDFGKKAESPEIQVEYYSKCLELDPKNAVAWLYKGISLAHLGRYEEALECCDRAIKANPNNTALWYCKGNALSDLERYEDAVGCYDRAIKFRPKHDATWLHKGISLAHLGRYEVALECYDRAIKLYPEYGDAWYNKGISLDHLGRYKKAVECYKKALEVSIGGIRPSWFYSVKESLKTGEEKLRKEKTLQEKTLKAINEAKSTLQKAKVFGCDISEVETLLNKVISEFERGDYEEAISNAGRSEEVAKEIKEKAKPEISVSLWNRQPNLSNLPLFLYFLSFCPKNLFTAVST